MSRITRSRRNPIVSVDSSTKTDNHVKAVVKEKNKMATSRAAKVLENNKKTSSSKNEKQGSNVRNTRSKRLISNPKLQPKLKCNHLINKSLKLTKNSSILQKSTHSFNKKNEINKKPMKTNSMLFQYNSKIKNKIMSDSKLLSETVISLCRLKDPEQIVGKKESNDLGKRKIELVKGEKEMASKKNKIIEKSSNKVNTATKRLEPNINKNLKSKDSKPFSSGKTNNENIDTVTNRLVRRIKISIEDVKRILNEEEEESEPVESNEAEVVNHEALTLESCDTDKIENTKVNDKVKNEQVTANKFFKNKHKKNEIKSTIVLKKSAPRQIKKPVNIDNIEDKYSLAPAKERKSLKPAAKQLRPRVKKNYCEISRLSENHITNEKELPISTTPTIESSKRIKPIYQATSSSQEKVENKEKVYDFPEDTQDNNVKIKKRKKVIRNVSVKRAKKYVIPRITGSEEKQKKNIRKGLLSVRFKEQNKRKSVKSSIPVEKAVPENPQDPVDDTLHEVSTIKILSNEKLNESNKINLTVTPSIPKTMSSDLKLFGGKSAIGCQPMTQYSNMVNHSLIRKSMSPIKKLVEDFDAGSPWRPIDAFSRVRQIVQSTPQIIRLPSMCKSKFASPKVNLINKSISLDDNVKVSQAIDNKAPNKLENTKASVAKNNETSPRKFGTVLSNINPMPCKGIQNINNNSPYKSNQLATIKNVILQTPHSDYNQQSVVQAEFAELPSNQELMADLKNKENSIVSPKKSLKKKFSTPSPFRFDRMHASKSTVCSEPQSKSQKSVTEDVNKEGKSETPVSRPVESKAMILVQSNLDNFLNIDEMPKETCISTVHGIFSDIHSTPVSIMRPEKFFEEPKLENAFGFDDDDPSYLSPVKNDIAKRNSVHHKKEVNGKENKKTNATSKVKDVLRVLSKNSTTAIKKPILKNVLKEKPKENTLDSFVKRDTNTVQEKDDKIVEKDVNSNEPKSTNKQTVLNSISFSDTFDILQEKHEITCPEELPLFIDLQPVHFNKPPRRSYPKRKREVSFDINKSSILEEEEESDEPKMKKKKITKASKEERKRVNDWVKTMNETFNEIDSFDLVVE